MNKVSEKTKENIGIVLGIMIYVTLFITIRSISSEANFNIVISKYKFNSSILNGLIAQTQIMILVLLVIFFHKKGYFTALILNVISIGMAMGVFLIKSTVDAFTGIIVYIGTMIIISILYKYIKKITEQKKQLNKFAYYDYLTGIANRTMIMERLDNLTKSSIKGQNKFALVFIDIDNFKEINDTMGHEIGDLLLKSLVDKMNKIINHKDLFGRIGGDEFVLIIQRTLTKEQILSYLDQVRVSILGEFNVGNKEYYISASFGVALFPQDSINVSDLLKYADMAMYYVKNNGKNAVEFYSDKMQDEVINRIKIESGLKKSISKNELFLVYQPQYDSNSNEIRGFESLLRWNSHDLGFVSPADFIPIAEKTGSIVEIGEWVLNTALHEFKTNLLNYNHKYVLSVNISPVQLINPIFVNMVKKALEYNHFNPKNLELEITESVFISCTGCVGEIIEQLRDMGISIALDDFGTGYSSLSYLQNFPMDILKIDKTFVDKILLSNPNKSLIEPIISMAHKLHMKVVAEGVEEQKQAEYLQIHNCDFLQGYLFSKPLKIENINNIYNIA